MFFVYPTEAKHVFKLNPQLGSVEAFKKLNAKEMCTVMLIADYYSPAKYYKITYGEEYMRMKICEFTGYTRKNGQLTTDGKRITLKQNEDVETAINVYRTMQPTDALEEMTELRERLLEYLEGPGKSDYVWRDFKDWVYRTELILTKGLISRVDEEIDRVCKKAYEKLDMIDPLALYEEELAVERKTKYEEMKKTEALDLLQRYNLHVEENEIQIGEAAELEIPDDENFKDDYLTNEPSPEPEDEDDGWNPDED